MYLHQYGLKAKPFQISTDPTFLWMGEKHREALAVLVYGVHSNRGFLMLSGGVGTGKTTLIRSLLAQLDKKVTVATITDPGLAPVEFFNFIAHAYGMRRRYTSKVAFLFDFEKFLRRTRDAGRTALLIVDEAQRLTHPLLEEIRLLSNIEDPDQKLLNIFFVGQEEFLEILAAPENRALKQRITINYHLEPLNAEETAQLVRHRLEVAGATREVFTADAFPEIHAFSGGAPRLINILCDHALLTGFVREVDTIDAAVVAECMEDLMLPGEDGRPPPQPVRAQPPSPVPHQTATAATAGMMLQEVPPPRQHRKWPWAAAALLLLVVGLGALWQQGSLTDRDGAFHRPQAPLGRVATATEAAPLIGHEIPDPLPPGPTEDVQAAKTASDERVGIARTEPVPAAQGDVEEVFSSAGHVAPAADTLPSPVETSAEAPTPPTALAGTDESPAGSGGADLERKRTVPPAEPVREATPVEDVVNPTPTPVAAFGRPTPVQKGLPATGLPLVAETPEPERHMDTATAPAPIPTEDRIHAFIDAYCHAYESRDLARFRLFFTEDAVERGRPIDTVLPVYARNFESLDDLAYGIALLDWKRDATAETITLSGIFDVRYRLRGRDWQTTRGEITMDLTETEGVFRVKRLDYEKK